VGATNKQVSCIHAEFAVLQLAAIFAEYSWLAAQPCFLLATHMPDTPTVELPHGETVDLHTKKYLDKKVVLVTTV